MTNEELERWCFLFASVTARQEIKIRVLRRHLLLAGLVSPENLARVEGLALEEEFQVQRGRYTRMLRAFWQEQDPDHAIRAWLDGLDTPPPDPPTRAS